MNDWTIRRAESRDADGLARCIDAAYASYVARIDDLPPVSEGCAEEIAQHLVWVAESGGTIIAGLVLVPSEGFMLLANVAVHPDQRGTGLGRRLLRLAESEAVSHGYADLRLTTHAAMPETIGLYARNGWAEIGREGNKVRMRKVLSGFPLRRTDSQDLLDQFLSEDCDSGLATELLAEIEACEGRAVIRSHTSNRFNLHLDYETYRARVEDDLQLGEDGEVDMPLATFKKALHSKLG